MDRRKTTRRFVGPGLLKGYKYICFQGLYFGPEHPADHPNAGLPLHGQNLFPDKSVPEMRPVVLEYIEKVCELGKLLSDLISVYFDLPHEYMRHNFLKPEPISIVRCFRYFKPPTSVDRAPTYGIGEHTDFGYLTILNQNKPGLQVCFWSRTRSILSYRLTI